MSSLIRKQLLEFKSDNQNYIVLLFLLIPLSIATIVSNQDGMIFAMVICAYYTMQMSGKFFANESSERTIETTITLPLDFRTIFYGKLIALYIITFLPGLVIIFLFVTKTIITSSFTAEFIIIILIKLIGIMFTLSNITFYSLKTSFLSSNVIECAIRLTMPVIFFILPYTVFNELINAESEMMNSFIIFCAYIVLNLIVFFVFNLSLKKYNNKAEIMNMISTRKV